MLALMLFSCTPEEERNSGNDLREPVVTGGVVSVSEKTVTLYGFCNDAVSGGNAMGILLSRESSPSLENGQKASSRELDKDNKFSVSFSQLAPGTQYYYAAYLNYGGTYKYGAVKTFITKDYVASVQTLEAQGIGETKVKLTGDLKVESHDALSVQRYIILGEGSQTESQLMALQKASRYNCDQGFSISLNNLKPNTLYSYLAYAQVEGKVFSGEVKTFTTTSVNVQVTTLDATSVTETTASLLANVSSQSSTLDLSNTYFYYGTNQGQLSSSVKATSSGNGQRYANLKDLTPNTTYFYQVRTTVAGESFNGEIRSFTTSDYSVVFSPVVTGITEKRATISGTITVESKESPGSTAYSLYYSDSQSGAEGLLGTKEVKLSCPNGSFTQALSDLKPDTEYHYLFRATVNGRYRYVSAVNSFRTLAPKVSVVTKDAERDSDSKICLRGNVQVESKESLSVDCGFLYLNAENHVTNQDSEQTILRKLTDSGVKLTAYRNSDGSFSYTFNFLDKGVYYYIAFAKVEGQLSYGALKSFDAERIESNMPVDLGLSVKWASSNLAATDTNPLGSYYGWGELEIKNSYYWDSYKYAAQNANGAYYITDYCDADGRYLLDSGDDSAKQILGGSWRMPTSAEWQELIKNCVWKIVTEKGISGYRVSSNKTGNSIFLPYAGAFSKTKLEQKGTKGLYWCSDKPYPNADAYASVLVIEGESISVTKLYRYFGLQIRPVCK